MSKVRNVKTKIVALGTLIGASATTFAADHSTAIEAAGTDGTTNVGAAVVVVVVLAIVAVVTGVGFVMKLLGR